MATVYILLSGFLYAKRYRWIQMNNNLTFTAQDSLKTYFREAT